MIRKTIIGLLVLATLGAVALWAFAFFGGPYATDWDLTDRIWCLLILAPGRCEVNVARFHPMWVKHPTPAVEKYMADARTHYKSSHRRGYQGVISWLNLPTTFGFGSHYCVPATMFFPASSTWYGTCPSWALLILAGLLGTYPGVVFIRRPFRRARRLRNGWCLGCGYDLQGNISGVCPECGTLTGRTA